MHGKIILTFTALLFLSAKGSRDDPGQQIFTASTPETPLPAPTPQHPSQSPLPKFKEVIVYLTPTQIKALQTGQGILEPILGLQSQQQQEPELTQTPHHNYENDEEFKKELERQKAYIETQPNIDEAISIIQKQREKTPPPVREPSREGAQNEPDQLSWYPKGGSQYYNPTLNQYPSTANPENNKYYGPSSEQTDSSKLLSDSKPVDLANLQPNSYNYFSVYNEKIGDNINIKIFHPAPKDKLRDESDAKEFNARTIYAPLIKKYKWLPYEYKKSSDWQPIGSSEGSRVTQKNAEHLNSLFSPAKPEEQSQSFGYGQENSNLDEESLKQKYASRYNDQKHAIEIENLIEKQNAAAHAEAIAQTPPVEVQREVSITKHKPIEVIKHVQVPVPQPYIVRVPEPFEVKVPQPYPVPLEIIRHVPVEVVKTEKIEVEKPVPYEVEKHVPVPVTKKVYVKVDQPYLVEKVVPVEVRKEIPVHIPIHKPQKLTILRHVWEH
ncbi:probable serine/threonine-protein kinase kinX [Plodia interpunctella]|uniref:probable serine/threonine-protein kinase kinX n=1 Tax=Plodia interpunctella TaxID=58824 RepID=UPI002368F1DF|nr:probable serine/threonine-protein kinase kinX [Plodia interpunctella]